jgi:hypothetical protein
MVTRPDGRVMERDDVEKRTLRFGRRAAEALQKGKRQVQVQAVPSWNRTKKVETYSIHIEIFFCALRLPQDRGLCG